MLKIIARGVPFGLGIALAACATPPQAYNDMLARSEASYRGAEEAGADGIPFARLHLKMSADELDKAKRLEANGKDEEAERMLESARADAELAIGLARQGHAELLVSQAQAQLAQLQATQSPTNVPPNMPPPNIQNAP